MKFVKSFEKVALFGFGGAAAVTPPPPPPKPPANAVQASLNKAFGFNGQANIIGRK